MTSQVSIVLVIAAVFTVLSVVTITQGKYHQR